ncbi:hypothetical protein [Hyperthermus butylicus]|uniref:Uncharacterized protein n=1 Tax=Hyperthermus butylicus (strain DSM 5456 / JCM 9403 / PLM1-5) TaxID=415426 RepID=A2BJY5_HYPBU|nr:hypothetical protein [Hyperthermus butylicus]ABM80296.1 hypothetical protein Hbut_0430 [Hyperthermus butylicus DSM 5456]
MSLDEAFAKIISEKEARLLRPVASQLGAALKEYGFVRLYVFPSIDAALAAAIVVNVLQRNNLAYAVRFTVKPPGELVEPSLLIGYPASVAEEVTARRPSALIGYGEQPQGILPIPVAVVNDSSVAALTAAVLSEVTIVGPFMIYGVIAGYWRELDRGKKASFTGFENALLDLLKLENRVEEMFTLRLFRWALEPTEEALALTLDPYLPGLTGNRDAAVEFLKSDPRLAQLLGKRVSEAPEHPLTVLGEKLYEILKKASRVPRRASEVIGFIYTSYTAPLPDLREASLVLADYAERVGLYSLLSLGVEERLAAAAAYTRYLKDFSIVVQVAEQVLSSTSTYETRRAGKLQLAVFSENTPVLLADRVLRKLGYLAPEQIPAKRSGDKLLVSLEEVASRLGYQQLVQLVESGCIAPIEASVWGWVNAASC